MGNIIAYSGLSTKIRAMQSKLITEEQLAEIVQLRDVPQVASYLKRTPQYAQLWASLDENALHRGQLEKLLTASIFSNFSRIYRFANSEQRKFLDLYSKRYEIRIIKEIMTNLFDHRDTDPVDITPYSDFFQTHSKMNLETMITCRSMDELIESLRGNEFYKPLSQIRDRENALLFDYGMALDLCYFSLIWNVRKKLFSGRDLEEITLTYGEKFDMLNLQFIQRSRLCFDMPAATILTLLIPVNYRLRQDEIEALISASTQEEFQQIFSRTYYGKKYEKLAVQNLEDFYNYILRTTLEKESRRDPYSVAVLYSYLYHKEHEVRRLIIAVESVRYGVAPDEAMRYICNN